MTPDTQEGVRGPPATLRTDDTRSHSPSQGRRRLNRRGPDESHPAGPHHKQPRAQPLSYAHHSSAGARDANPTNPSMDEFLDQTLDTADQALVPLAPLPQGWYDPRLPYTESGPQLPSPASGKGPLPVKGYLAEGIIRAGLAHAPRFNVRTEEVVVGDRVLSGDEVGRAYTVLNSQRFEWQPGMAADYLRKVASENPFDPVADYLDDLGAGCEPMPMDIWERLGLHLLNVDDPTADMFLQRFFISAVARTYEPGCPGRTWPLLVGPQHVGKSEVGRILFGVHDGWWDETGLGKMDRDVLDRLHCCWGFEMSEFNMSKSHIEGFKTLASARWDTYRSVWGRGNRKRPRRSVFWGTSNSPQLNDTTGSTRLAPIALGERMLPMDWARANRNALWARAVERYHAKVCWHKFSPEERLALGEQVEAQTIRHPWTDRICAVLDGKLAALVPTDKHEVTPALLDSLLPVQVPELLAAVEVPLGQQNNGHAVVIKSIVEAHGWEWGRHRLNGGSKDNEGFYARKKGLWPKHYKELLAALPLRQEPAQQLELPG